MKTILLSVLLTIFTMNASALLTKKRCRNSSRVGHFCDSISGYYDIHTDSCFQVHICGNTYNTCANQCKYYAGVSGVRGRLGIIATKDLVDRIKTGLPTSFNVAHDIFVGMKTLIPDADHEQDWFWYEDNTAIAPVTIYSGWTKKNFEPGEDCGYLNPAELKMRDKQCNHKSKPYMLCEFLQGAFGPISKASPTTTSHASTGAKDCTEHVCTISDKSLRFLVIGDSGGTENYPYYTDAQKITANAMGKMAHQKKSHFQMALGDNFYNDGVSNVNDHRFKDTFEDVYTNPALYTPWYVINGNHDYHGNPLAEVWYTQKSKRWNFPSLYYAINYKLIGGTTIEFVMIDTQPLKYYLEGYEKQWAWIKKQLRSSSANYLFVVGHHPVYSAGKHGSTEVLAKHLQPMLSSYRVSAYLSGHDHNLEVKWQHNGTGIGGDICYVGENMRM